jgi:hypothetical protein
VNTIVNPRELQRLRYTPDQDLLSRDFRDQSRFDEQLRWWHNRAMHGAFGVRYGLSVRALTSTAEPQVEVEAGVAYDSFGREVILLAPRSLQVPAGPNETQPRVLVIRYRGHEGHRSSGGMGSGCCSGLAPQNGDLVWLQSQLLRPTDGVPLARVLYDDGEPLLDERFHTPAARPLARPRLGGGSTVAGNTKWEIWDLGLRRSFLVALQVSLDTRAAGFTEIPCYFAWLQGGLETRFDLEGPPLLLPLYTHVAAATLTGFRFRVLTFALSRGVSSAAAQNLLLSMARRQLTVCWLGIQMRGDQDALSEVTHEHS